MRAVPRIIDRIIVWQAEVSSHLMTLLVIIMCLEVFLRYVLKSPTVWGLEFTTFLYGMHFLLGYSYTEHFHGHVCVDIFAARLSKRTQRILYIVTTTFISLPTCILLAIWGWDNAWLSTRTLERSPSAWNPEIWHVKIVMAIGFTLLAMQVLSNIIKKFYELTDKPE